MDPSKEIKALITGTKAGKAVPIEDILRISPRASAIISKLNTTDKHTKHDNNGNRTIVAPNQSGMADISKDVARISEDNENTLQLFPELEQALRILINSVLAPKDQTTQEIVFGLPPDLKVSPLSALLMPIVEKALSKDLKLKEMLPDMLYAILGGSGAYPVGVIPESVVDDMINDRTSISTESLTEAFGNGTSNIKTHGFIGNSDYVSANVAKEEKKERTFGFEDFVNTSAVAGKLMTDNKVMFRSSTKSGGSAVDVDTLIRVTDNIDILKFPDIVNTRREMEINKRLGLSGRSSIYNGQGFEDYRDLGNIHNNTNYGSRELNDIQLQQLLYKDTPNLRNVTRKIKTSNDTERYNVGQPLFKLFPAESVIPVCMSGDVRKHIAYFILLDGVGNPLSKDAAGTVYDDFRRAQMGSKSSSGGNLSSHLLQRTADAFSTSCDTVTYQQMSRVTAQIIETDFLARARNGLMGEDTALVDNSAFYDILTARMYREQYTQVLFMPASLMTYFAFKYRKNGTGKTLLEDSQVINTLRAVLMFSNVNRAVINSIGRTEVEVTLDENDPAKNKTLDIVKHEMLKGRQSQALPATVSPTDINQYLKTSQVYFNINAVRGMPGTSLKVNETSSNYVKPDTELTGDLDRKAVLGLGVPPELVAETDGVEFATNIVSNNIRLNKQVVAIQDAVQPKITGLGRTYCMNHGDVVREVEEVIRSNLDKITQVKSPDDIIGSLEKDPELLIRLLAREFLSNFTCGLSRPDTVTLKNQMEAFEEYEKGLDTLIKYYLSDDILSEATSGSITKEQAGLLFNSIKAFYVRDWLRRNTVMPELYDIVQSDDKDAPSNKKNIFELTSSYSNSVTQHVGEFLKRVMPVAAAMDRDLTTASQGDPPEAGPGVATGGGSTDTGGDDDTSGGEDSSGEGGGDDLGDDLGLPGMPDLGSF